MPASAFLFAIARRMGYGFPRILLPDNPVVNPPGLFVFREAFQTVGPVSMAATAVPGPGAYTFQDDEGVSLITTDGLAVGDPIGKSAVAHLSWAQPIQGVVGRAFAVTVRCDSIPEGSAGFNIRSQESQPATTGIEMSARLYIGGMATADAAFDFYATAYSGPRGGGVGIGGGQVFLQYDAAVTGEFYSMVTVLGADRMVFFVKADGDWIYAGGAVLPGTIRPEGYLFENSHESTFRLIAVADLGVEFLEPFDGSGPVQSAGPLSAGVSVNLLNALVAMPAPVVAPPGLLPGQLADANGEPLFGANGEPLYGPGDGDESPSLNFSSASNSGYLSLL